MHWICPCHCSSYFPTCIHTCIYYIHISRLDTPHSCLWCTSLAQQLQEHKSRVYRARKRRLSCHSRQRILSSSSNSSNSNTSLLDISMPRHAPAHTLVDTILYPDTSTQHDCRRHRFWFSSLQLVSFGRYIPSGLIFTSSIRGLSSTIGWDTRGSKFAPLLLQFLFTLLFLSLLFHDTMLKRTTFFFLSFI